MAAKLANMGIPACPPQKVSDVPALREDLQLFAAAPNSDGSPAWMIQDPVTNRFFRIGWLEFELISRWHLGNPALILISMRRETPLQIGVNDINNLSDFLRQQQLVRASSVTDSEFVKALAKKQQEGWFAWLLHNYLFFRLPLIRPAYFLQATFPLIKFFYSRAFLIFTLFCTLLGLYLVARQWDHFLHTASDLLSLKGLASFAVALTFAKCLHELGHAYTATKYRVNVAHMGVAFLVMWPMLYTDTSESWKLTNRRHRFHIAAAGVIAELSIASFATLAWALADDGALRSALFFLATASWVMTLAINASPFMRFDGYFLLSDALDMPNLHARSGAFARVWMRRRLLGLTEEWPESLPASVRQLLIMFALLTWAYRLVLFLGIAAAVYYFFFKALGIFLFVIEIAWFIVKPVWSELKVWRERRASITGRAKIGWLFALSVLGFLLVFPWRSDVSAPSLLRSTQQTLVFSPLPARIAQVRAAGPVKAGELLMVLDSPDARSRANQSAALVQSLALQLDQTVGRLDGAESRAIIQEQLGERLAEVQAQDAEIARLALRAAYDGYFLDTDPFMSAGVWVNGGQAVGILVDPRQWVVEGLVEQRDLERIKIGSPAKFFWKGQWRSPLMGEVVSIDSTRAQLLPHVLLASEHGGSIAATRGTADNSISIESKSTGLIPRDSLYKVRIQINNEQLNELISSGQLRTMLQSGTTVIEGQAQSIGFSWFRSVAAVLIRESGF